MLPSDKALPPYKSVAIQDSFGYKGAFFLGIHHNTERLFSVMNKQIAETTTAVCMATMSDVI